MNVLPCFCSTMKAEGTVPEPAAQTGSGPGAFGVGEGPHGNNYGRPEGQNVGNFLTDRPSSRVLAAPGGASQIFFGEDVPEAKKVRLFPDTLHSSPTLLGGARRLLSSLVEGPRHLVPGHVGLHASVKEVQHRDQTSAAQTGHREFGRKCHESSLSAYIDHLNMLPPTCIYYSYNLPAAICRNLEHCELHVAQAALPTVNIDATGSNSLYMGAKHEDTGASKSNNYGRPEGQNVGNFLTDRSSSRVLAPPGGASQIFFG